MACKHKIIFDVDPGVDDALAILMAAGHPDIELLGLTTSYGNVSVDTATKNANYIAHLIAPYTKEKIPVYRGISKPLLYDNTKDFAEFVHGKGGLGGLTIPDLPHIKHDITAAQFIVQTVKEYPQEVTLVAVAPIGNVALAMLLEPELPKLCKAIYIMGCSFYRNGNISPVAEANTYNSPHASDIVFGGRWSDESTITPLDVTYSTYFSDEWMEELSKCNRLAKWSYDISRFYAKFYHSVDNSVKGVFAHDAYAIAAMTNPELFTYVSGGVRVVTEGMCRGQSIIDANNQDQEGKYWRQRPCIKAAMSIDAPRLFTIVC